MPRDLTRKGKYDVYEIGVLIHLMSFDPCHPSIENIAESLMITKRRAMKALKSLEEKGAIQKYKKTGHVNYYKHAFTRSEDHVQRGDHYQSSTTPTINPAPPTRCQNDTLNRPIEIDQSKKAASLLEKFIKPMGGK